MCLLVVCCLQYWCSLVFVCCLLFVVEVRRRVLVVVCLFVVRGCCVTLFMVCCWSLFVVVRSCLLFAVFYPCF